MIQNKLIFISWIVGPLLVQLSMFPWVVKPTVLQLCCNINFITLFPQELLHHQIKQPITELIPRAPAEQKL